MPLHIHIYIYIHFPVNIYIYIYREMLEFGSCWKCEEMNKVRVLNSKLLIDVCNRVCDYDKCDK